MGRYYSGDIEGKFAFAMQCSSAPEIFGAEIQEPSHIDYYIEEDKIDFIILKISELLAELGDGYDKIEKMFAEQMGYNDDILKEYGIQRKELVIYYDLRLGQQIRDYMLAESSGCYINAEL